MTLEEWPPVQPWTTVSKTPVFIPIANSGGVGDAAIAGVGCPAVPGLPGESPRVSLAMVPPSVALVTMLSTEMPEPVC